MGLIFITGNSGAGKSAVRLELQRRGYDAYDTDDISNWYNKETGRITRQPADDSGRTHEWYEAHDWNMSAQRVAELSAEAHEKTIFLCGSPSNDLELLHLYKKVVFLKIDENTLRSRLISRTDNEFGKAPDELANILSWHSWMEDTYKSRNAIVNDATKTLSEVVDAIIRTTSME